MSQDFFELDSDEQINSFAQSAQEMLAGYGLTQAKVVCINFEFNATFSVESESGEKYALRINVNSTRTPENILAEIEFVNFLARVQGINVPRPIANGDNNFVSSMVHGDSGRTIYGVLYSWLEGEEIGDEPNHDQLFSVGVAMATMHQSSRDFNLSNVSALPTFSDWLWGTEDYLLSEKTLLNSEQFNAVSKAVEEIENHMNELFESTEIQVIHGDLHGWNLMWHEGKLSIFDFDDCGFGIPHQDLAVTLYYLDTPDQEASVIAGYKSVCALPDYSKAQMDSLLLQRRLVLLNYLYETKNAEHKAMLPVYLEKTMERIAKFLNDVRR